MQMPEVTCPPPGSKRPAQALPPASARFWKSGDPRAARDTGRPPWPTSSNLTQYRLREGPNRRQDLEEFCCAGLVTAITALRPVFTFLCSSRWSGLPPWSHMFFICERGVYSQAERRRFEPGLPLHLFNDLAARRPTFSTLEAYFSRYIALTSSAGLMDSITGAIEICAEGGHLGLHSEHGRCSANSGRLHAGALSRKTWKARRRCVSALAGRGNAC